MDGSERGKPLAEVLSEIAIKNKAKFFFRPEWISSLSFTESQQGQTLEQALVNLFLGTELNFFAMYPGTVVIVKDAKQSIQRKEAIQDAIREKKTIEQYVLGDQGTSTKGTAILKGKIIDSKSGDPLSQVNIYIADLKGWCSHGSNGKLYPSGSPGFMY